MSVIIREKYQLPENTEETASYIEELSELAEIDPAKAIEISSAALKYAAEKGDRPLEAGCLRNIAIAFYNLREYKSSLENANKALEIFEAVNDSKGIADSLNNKGRVFIEIGKYDEALRDQLGSLKILEKLGDKKGISKLYNNIGLIYWYCENFQMALEYHRKSLEIKQALDDKKGIARTFNNLGNVYKYLGEHEKAIDCYVKALNLNEELDNKKGISFCLNNLGTVYKDLDNNELALKYYNRSLTIKYSLDDKPGIANTYLNLGILNSDIKDFKSALEYYDKGLKLAEEENIKSIQKNFYYNYMELFSATGEHEKALEYFKKYVELKESLFNDEIARRFTELQLRYEIEKMESENELLRGKNEIQRLELESQKNLKELNATKDKFFSIISHDLKSPFAVMTSFLNILKNTENFDKDNILELVNEMDKTVKASISLLENLLEWSRTQTGRMAFSPQELNLKAVAENSISLLWGNALAKNITLADEIDLSCTVYADKNMLNTIFRNLISNAIKFSSPGGEIKISASPKDSVFVVSIADCGIGIEEEHRNKIFSIDTKIHTKGTAGEKGTGIGLILCREFVERNWGKIWVESTPGKGSTFYFTLPKASD